MLQTTLTLGSRTCSACFQNHRASSFEHDSMWRSAELAFAHRWHACPAKRYTCLRFFTLDKPKVQHVSSAQMMPQFGRWIKERSDDRCVVETKPTVSFRFSSCMFNKSLYTSSDSLTINNRKVKLILKMFWQFLILLTLLSSNRTVLESIFHSVLV